MFVNEKKKQYSFALEKKKKERKKNELNRIQDGIIKAK